MKKNYTLLVMLYVLTFVVLSTLKINAQLNEVILWDKQDATVSKAEPTDPHGDAWNIEVHNEDGPNHGWIQWDLQWLLDTIPEGEEVLYAEMAINITNTWDPDNGFYAILLDNDVFDYWDEETFTWSNSELMTGKNPYDSTYHDTLYFEEDTPSRAGGSRTFEVTSQVKKHMSDGGNKLISIRLSPYNTENDVAHWLGFYAREARWDPTLQNPFVEEQDEIIIYTPRIKAYYGQMNTQFSDVNYFGDKSNYLAFPKNPVEFWSVDTIGGVDDDRMIVQGEKGSFPKVNAGSDGLGAMLIYDKQVYDEFDVTFDAKLSKADFSNPNLIDPEDIAFVFDWIDENTYSCFLFHQVDTIGRFFKVKNGKRTLTDDVDLDFENNAANPKYDDFHAYQITRTSSVITVKIDGITVGFTDNTEFLNGSGKIGVGTLNNQVYFDNFEELSGDVTPPTVPTGLVVTTLTSTTATFAWDALIADEKDGELIYDVYKDSVFITSIKDTTLTVKGLTPNTTYHFMVSAIDSSGNESELSDTLKVLTKLSAPEGLKVDALTSASVSFSWDALVNGEMLYRIYKNGVYSMSTVDESIIISNLNPNTMYAFTVVAIDSAGNDSEYSKPLQVSTIKSGIREYNVSGIEIYPTLLTSGELTVDLRKVNDANISIVITSITGKLIYSEQVNNDITIISTEKLTNGIYIVTVKGQDSVLEQCKIVVVK